MRRLASFPARNKTALFEGLRAIDLSGLQPSGVRATARKSKLVHTGMLEDALREVAGLDKRSGKPPSEEPPAKEPPAEEPPAEEPATGELRLRMEHDQCTVSVVMGANRLDHRGWRTDVGPAPLRESVAAAVLRIARWDRRVPLIDPMCGSGVLLVEAAAWAEGMPEAPLIHGSDVRPQAVEAARRHDTAAGVDAAVTWAVVDLADLRVEESEGLVICNPPWGKRLEVADVYAELGRTLRRFKGWRAAVITPKGEAAKDFEGTLGRGPVRVVPFRHGGVPVALRLYKRLGRRAVSRRRR
jgi:putative N6-adenine-specific DNA methylase